MNTIHLSEAQKEEMARAAHARKTEFEKKLVELMIAEKMAVMPRMVYTTRGIGAEIDFEEIPDDKVEEYKKRVANDEK